MEQEYIARMGRLISGKRKEKGFTQKELAARLGVTDKAVSKWERGSCCPDISLLLPLAECLEISVGELLGDEKNPDFCGETISCEKHETPLNDSEAEAFKESSGRPKAGLRRWLLLGFSAACLAAVLICLICDYSIAGKLSWSYVVCCSVLLGWAVLVPIFQNREKGVFWALAVLTILILPYLAVLSLILRQPLIIRVGLPAAVLSAAGLWCLYYVFRRLRGRLLYAWALTCIILGIISFFINGMIAFLIKESSWTREESIFNGLVALVLAAACAGAEYWRSAWKQK